MISLTDEINQAIESPISITVFDWASKDWEKWTGIYENNWTIWTQNYFLDNTTGKWYRSYSYW